MKPDNRIKIKRFLIKSGGIIEVKHCPMKLSSRIEKYPA